MRRHHLAIFHIFVDIREKYEQNKLSYFSLKLGAFIILANNDQSGLTAEQS
jgi:hypothetical protein